MAFKDYDTATVVQAVKIHMLDPHVGMYYPTIAHVTAKLQRAENLIAMTASTRARTAITAERAEMPHRDVRALETYKHVSEEWDEADGVQSLQLRPIFLLLPDVQNGQAMPY